MILLFLLLSLESHAAPVAIFNMHLLIFIIVLCSVFQEHTERMRKKLHDQMVKKVDNEDERIKKALAEREHQREVIKLCS